MKIDLMAKIITDAIWTTDDYGGELLNKECTRYIAAIISREHILREYMYLKARIASGLVYEAVANEQEYNRIMCKVLDILKDTYSTASSSAHGCKYSELLERLSEYLEAGDWDEVARLFSKHLYFMIIAAGGSDKLVNKNGSLQFVEGVVSSMREKFIPLRKK